ncbi:hypothetical protein JOC54_004240 [Alkalihalobacillus xiaoxiensis]|uniref:Uncharacterized protein n=1 Tax=Shouchella xiaoxiensis TaxID=766895 RepID=A0ABS2T0H2_9BACI|nr:hypothetical protein [Shouchella xiaoxiensis]MBM7840946.1 hypothetical protein [Shouchella xiaoxiensis]
MKKTLSNAVIASLVVALITVVLSFMIRGHLNWMDVLNSVIGTFIIWAVFIPLVNKHWRGHQID